MNFSTEGKSPTQTIRAKSFNWVRCSAWDGSKQEVSPRVIKAQDTRTTQAGRISPNFAEPGAPGHADPYNSGLIKRAIP